jgi:hypothetical protein
MPEKTEVFLESRGFKTGEEMAQQNYNKKNPEPGHNLSNHTLKEVIIGGKAVIEFF